MEKKNKIIFFVVLVVTIILVVICSLFVINNNKNINSDAYKFRNEYMELNDKLNELTNRNHPDVFISETNTVKYINAKEAIKMLESGSGIIYFGYATCIECRLLVPTLTEICEKEKENIYYLDVSNMRSSFVVENGAIKKIKDGTEEYYKILSLLDKQLDDLYLVDDSGNMYNTEEKNFFVPILVGLNKGEIRDIHTGVVSGDSISLKDVEKKELEKRINNLINNIKDIDVCEIGNKC